MQHQATREVDVMSDKDTSNTGDGGTAADTSTETAAAEGQSVSTGTSDEGANGTGINSGDSQQRQSGREQDFASLPKWAQKEISDLRKTNGDYRMSKKDAEQKHQGTLEAIAKALGLKENEKPEPDRLAEQLNELQEQFSASQRRTEVLELAAEHEIPKDYQHLLTASDHDTLVEQAKGLGELVKAKNEAAGTPAFQPNPGQGQGGGTATLAEQMAAAQAEGDQAKVRELKTRQLMELRNRQP